MNYQGWWQNQEYKGEGLMLWDALDGSVAGCWFAPDDGEGGQLWLVVSGNLDDAGGSLRAFRVTADGERFWGDVYLDQLEPSSRLIYGEILIVTFSPEGHPREFERELTRHPAIHAAPPADVPPIVIQKNIAGTWKDLSSFPLTGRTDPSNRHRLIFNQDDRITRASATGEYNPKISLRRDGDAIGVGASVKAGDVIEVRYSMSPGWEQEDGGNYKWGAWFAVETAEAGKVIELAVQVKA